MKVNLVILLYKNWHFLLQMLGRIPPNVQITIVHNLSDETRQFSETLNDWVNSGIIHKHIEFERNIANNAITEANKYGLLDVDCDYFILSDGDLLPDRGWLDEHIKILDNHNDVFLVSSDLYMDNLPSYGEGWVPPAIDCGDYLLGRSGTHLTTFRGEDFVSMAGTLSAVKGGFVDDNYHCYASIVGKKSAKTKATKSKHLTWDLYQDKNHSYTVERLNNPGVWKTKDICNYKVTLKNV